MYLCVSGHVFVCQRSCICVLEVMYLCVRGHVFVCQGSCICVLEVMYQCVRGIGVTSFYDFGIEFYNYSDSVVYCSFSSYQIYLLVEVYQIIYIICSISLRHRKPQHILYILLRPFGSLSSQRLLNYLVSVLEESYSRNLSCTLIIYLRFITLISSNETGVA